ncbi:MAG TPA: extracellular solute-binding protein, partial [Clostridia bacterium]|nr:extracellular solute-binding protein [Clostridia bacterium]
TYQQKVDLLLTSDSIPDVIQLTSTTAPTIVKAFNNGTFWDLTDYLGDFSNYTNFRDHTNLNAWSLSKIKGRNYFMPRTRGNLDSALFIRQDWLDKLGLETPKTLEELRVALKAIVASDCDGNGQNDTIGIQPNNAFLGAFDNREVTYTEDGQGIIHRFLTPAYAEYVAYMSSLFSDGLISAEYPMIKGQQQEELFLSGRMATYMKNAWHKYRCETELQKVQEGAKVELMPALEGPNGYAHIYDLGFFGGTAISSKVPEEKMLKILDFFNRTCAPEYYNLVNYGIEGVHYVLVDGFPSLTEQGKLEVTNSFNAPFIFATAEFAKVDSPLAPMSYNLQTREKMMELYTLGGTGGKVEKFNVLQSDSWSSFWSKTQEEFEAMEASAITGEISIEDFIAYQQSLLEDPEVVASFAEFMVSYRGYFGE